MHLLDKIPEGILIHLARSSAPEWTTASTLLLVLEGLLPLAGHYPMKLILDTGQADVSRTLTLATPAGLVALLTALSRTAPIIVRVAQAAMVSDSIQDILHAQSVALDPAL